MSRALLDDHLLRDLLANELSADLSALLAEREPATTNVYYLRLSRSVVSARGGQLTGGWSSSQRSELGRSLIALPGIIEIVPVRTLAFRMAELAGANRLSTLGAEAVAASQHLDAPSCVWQGDDGREIRSAMAATGGTYMTVTR